MAMRLIRAIRFRLALLLRQFLYLERGTLVASGLASKVLRAVPEAACALAPASGSEDGTLAYWQPVDLWLMQDVHLVGSRCTPLDRGRRLVTEHTGGSLDTIKSQEESLEIWSLISCSLFRRPRRLDAVFSLCSPYQFNYYHWLVDCLPRLIAYEALLGTPHDRPALLVPPEPAPWQMRSLALMGYPPGSYIEQDSLHILAKNYYLTSWHKGATYATVPSPVILAWLRQRLVDSVQFVCVEPARKIFVDRSKSRRPVANSQELSQLFTRRGFISVRLEELSFDEQICLFASAGVVAGLHGAGFANLIFSESAWLFEIYSYGSPLLYYKELVHVLGGHYMCHLERSSAHGGLPRLTLSRIGAALDSFLEQFDASL
jgi:hypothetical protein